MSRRRSGTESSRASGPGSQRAVAGVRRRFRRKSDRVRLMFAAGLGAMWAVRSLRLSSYTLPGKTVVVTGGSRGLGLALAREVAAQGAGVAICGRDPGSLDRARRSLAQISAEVLAVTCDITQPASVAQLFEQVHQRFGPVDVLVNNAGVVEV